MKKLVSFILCTALAVSLCAGFALADEGLGNFKRVNTYKDGLFSDVSAKSWFVENVKNAYELDLMEGQGAGRFGAEGSVTYAETVALAARIHSIYHAGTANFTEGTPWYGVYYDYAAANRIISDRQYPDYNAPASRYDFVAILINAMPDSAFDTINHVEAGAISDVVFQTASHVYTFYRAGILAGVNDKGDFDPWSNIKRSEAAAVVSRMAVTALREEFTLTVGGSGQGDGEVVEYLREAYKAVGNAQSSFTAAWFASGSGNHLIPLTQSMTHIETAYAILEKVCEETKDTENSAKVYEYSNTAMGYCSEIAKGIQEVAKKPASNVWNTVTGYFTNALTYINGAINEAVK